MEDLFSLLCALNLRRRPTSGNWQRRWTFVGKVNGLLHKAGQEGYLEVVRQGKRNVFSITGKGRILLEGALLDRQQMKLSLPQEDEL